MSPTPSPQAPLTPQVQLRTRWEHGRGWPVAVWHPGPRWQIIASTVLGGGIGERQWWLNTQVPLEYHEPDPAAHADRIAAALGLPTDRPGVAMLTAADVQRTVQAHDHGVQVAATVGLSVPTWAAASAPEHSQPRPGTINVLVICPQPLSDAALVNAVLTATEAKAQALAEAGVPGTGTSSDAICIACPRPEPAVELAHYAGPRAPWGARIARAVHAAVAAGTRDWITQHGLPAAEGHA